MLPIFIIFNTRIIQAMKGFLNETHILTTKALRHFSQNSQALMGRKQTTRTILVMHLPTIVTTTDQSDYLCCRET